MTIIVSLLVIAFIGYIIGGIKLDAYLYNIEKEFIDAPTGKDRLLRALVWPVFYGVSLATKVIVDRMSGKSYDE